ncbi:MAG: FMN-binding protein [Acetivibrio ethanolgignens]
MNKLKRCGCIMLGATFFCGSIFRSAFAEEASLAVLRNSGIAGGIETGYILGFVEENNKKTLHEQLYSLFAQIAAGGDFLELISVDGEKDKLTLNTKTLKQLENKLVLQKKMKRLDWKTQAEKQKEKKIKKGVYEGIAQGYGGELRLEVGIEDEKITAVKVLSHNETPSYLHLAERVIEKLIGQRGVDSVDTISGATISSKAILNAVKDAISQASGATKKPGESKESKEIASGYDTGSSAATEPSRIDFSKFVLPDGEYKGRAAGYGGTIEVTVKVENGVISKVHVDSERETPSYYNKAQRLLGEVVKRNTTKIDTVSGATVTSKGILSAVEDALSRVLGKEKKEYADGIWYGQGRGQYSMDMRNILGEWNRATEVSVTVENGKVKDIKMENFGDDPQYNRSDKYQQFFLPDIIKNDGTEHLRASLAEDQRGKNEIYDAVSGATNSARGVLNAIDDALNRSAKYKKDAIPQEVRSITLTELWNGTVFYGEPVNLSKLTVKVKYIDGREEDVKFPDLAAKGVSCSLPEVFVPLPEGGDYGKARNYDLIFTHENSTSRHISYIQARRKVEKKKLTKIQLGEDADAKFINLNENQFSYQMKIGDKELNAIKNKKVKVMDSNNREVEVKEVKIVTYDKPTLLIELQPLPKAEPTDKIAEGFSFDFYRIELEIDKEFDLNALDYFRIINEPNKKNYSVGEKLNLEGLELWLQDSNYAYTTIGQQNLESKNFKISLKKGEKELKIDQEFEEAGSIKVTISYPEKPELTCSFDIEVTAKKESMEDSYTIKLQNNSTTVSEFKRKKEERIYYEIPENYKGMINNLDVKVFNQNNEEVQGISVDKSNSMFIKITFSSQEYDYVMITFKR